MRVKIVNLADAGVVVEARRVGELTIPYQEILTAERLRSGRGLHLHMRSAIEPIRVQCRRTEREVIESQLRFLGVRIVDCWGAIIAPTLLDFEEELAREPVRV